MIQLINFTKCCQQRCKNIAQTARLQFPSSAYSPDFSTIFSFLFFNLNICLVRRQQHIAPTSDKKTCWAIWMLAVETVDRREGLEIPERPASSRGFVWCACNIQKLSHLGILRLHVVTLYAGTEIPALLGPTRVVTNDPRSHATSGQSVKSGPTVCLSQHWIFSKFKQSLTRPSASFCVGMKLTQHVGCPQSFSFFVFLYFCLFVL